MPGRHPAIGPRLRGAHPEDEMETIRGIIRDAEERLGDQLPYWRVTHPPKGSEPAPLRQLPDSSAKRPLCCLSAASRLPA